ncbi:unnamed protein product [Schistosoma turkestanicum]|nr:unnamed protein product [Schistosoma turkestanicum]
MCGKQQFEDERLIKINEHKYSCIQSPDAIQLSKYPYNVIGLQNTTFSKVLTKLDLFLAILNLFFPEKLISSLLMINIPDLILEQIFIYLNWNERSRAARVCKKWYSAFQSPVLWRKIVFKPPCRRLTKLQYDIKGYRLSCCLKAIGCHIRTYKFLKTDDLFLLNRTLNLVAKFLEYNFKLGMHKNKPNYVCNSDGDESSDPSTETGDLSCYKDLNHNVMHEINYGLAGFIIEGDPDAEATLRLIFELQESEIHDFTSDLSSEDSQADFFNESEQFHSHRISSISYPPSHRYDCDSFKRSKSSQYPSFVSNFPAFHNPPIVHSFELDFNSEVDDLRGLVYGTGGGLLKSISRVIRQLNELHRLRLVDLFLASDDARQLVFEISSVASHCLTDLNLVHFYKSSVNALTANIISGEYQNADNASNDNSYLSLDGDWYFLDPRWLSARPQPTSDNPLCDLSSLFPKITRLTLSPTQLTGPMLLRLLYQTSLRELFLVQTDLTVFTIPRSKNPSLVQRTISYDSNDLNIRFNENRNFDPCDSSMLDLIDWTADVPHARRYGTSQEATSGWKPIPAYMWRAASTLRPRFTVHLKLELVEELTRLRWKSSSSSDKSNSIRNLLSYWPVPPAPVTSITLILTGEPTFVASLLSPKNPINPIFYSESLTSLIISLEHIPSELNVSGSIKQLNELYEDDNLYGLDHILHELIMSCPHINLLALGGSSVYVHILTLLLICHCRKYNPLQLLIQEECCQFEGVCPLTVPGAFSDWYNSMLTEPISSRSRMAESLICTALDRRRWHFLTNSEFRNQLRSYLL